MHPLMCALYHQAITLINYDREQLERDKSSYLDLLGQGTERCHPSRGDPKGIKDLIIANKRWELMINNRRQIRLSIFLDEQ